MTDLYPSHKGPVPYSSLNSYHLANAISRRELRVASGEATDEDVEVLRKLKAEEQRRKVVTGE